MNALRFHRISTRIKHVTRADSDRRFGLFREGDRFARSEAYTLLQSDPRRLPSSNFSTGRRRIDYPEGILRLSPISVSLITLEMYPTRFRIDLISIDVGCICRRRAFITRQGYVFRGSYLKNFSTNLREILIRLLIR